MRFWLETKIRTDDDAWRIEAVSGINAMLDWVWGVSRLPGELRSENSVCVMPHMPDTSSMRQFFNTRHYIYDGDSKTTSVGACRVHVAIMAPRVFARLGH